MKKLILSIFLMVSSAVTTVFCADIRLSAGGGGLLGYTFTRYTMEGSGLVSTQTMDRFNYAGFLFFDAQYGEFSVLIQGGNNEWTEAVNTSGGKFIDGKGTGSTASLGFSLLGKYPRAINEKFSWFPLFGAEYHVVLSEKRKPEGYDKEYKVTQGVNRTDRDKNDQNYPDFSAWNSLWIDLGAGLDYALSDPFFLRAELFFGFRLPTPYEMNALEIAKNEMKIKDPKIGGLTGSPTLKLACGYRW